MSVFEQEMESYEVPGLGEFGQEFETFETLGETESQEQFLPAIGGILGSIFGGQELEAPLSEVQEMALASEMLEITNEEELDRFIGNLLKGAAKAVGGFVRSPVGRALGGALKSVAKTALPAVGGALGTMIAPGVGTALGSKLGSMATKLFEVELEGLNEQEAEFEVARRYVRFASSAAAQAARAPQNAPPRSVARNAVTAAARQHAPGLLRGGQGGRPMPGRRPRRPSRGGGPAYYGYPPTYGAPSDYDEGDEGDGDGDGGQMRPRSGRWVRRGRKIVIFGI